MLWDWWQWVFFQCVAFRRADSVVLLPDIWGSVLPLKNNLNPLILTTVMSCMVFFWDYLLTFGMEVDLVWKSKWNYMKGLYLFQRYLPFLDTLCLVLYCQSDAFTVFFPGSLKKVFCSSKWEGVDKKCMCEDIPSCCRFLKLTFPTLTW